MIIPLTHENMKGRRWPYIAIAIIVLNPVAFLATHWHIEQKSRQIAQIEIHILLIRAAHPDLQAPLAAQKLVAALASTMKISGSACSRASKSTIRETWAHASERRGSPVPHLDWEYAIRAGLKETTAGRHRYPSAWLHSRCPSCEKLAHRRQTEGTKLPGRVRPLCQAHGCPLKAIGLPTY